MIAIALTVIVGIAVTVWMVWGDDGPLWQNWLTMVGFITVLCGGAAVFIWVAEYGGAT